ncbi:uncharacterized protein JN550_010682 [Neoarthrinium moseri]|uniref:uncharacterized protein n=1 Tax=Neoarthrinium moseri TaxID=1658444 RepID=UPI001FDE5AAD|nr:uncharacterized protein JN550_010682 [Neoarthrinium moseri]KAI1861742.1 hypothetical protein JN550_010682 [Neoarthrinium moseri]
MASNDSSDTSTTLDVDDEPSSITRAEACSTGAGSDGQRVSATESPPPSIEGYENCEICFDDALSTQFTTLPCEHGHRFMTLCITTWFQQLYNQQGPQVHCPKCREEFKYTACGHPLEAHRLVEPRNVLKADLMVAECLSCQRETRSRRFLKIRRDFDKHEGPDWDMIEPGDLSPALEALAAVRFADEYEELKEDFANRVRLMEAELEELKEDPVLSDSNSHVWALESILAGIERMRNAPQEAEILHPEIFDSPSEEDDEDNDDE